MFGSKDLNLPFPATTYKHGKEETDLFPHPNQMSSGLLRYRSAPSTLLGDVVCEGLVPNRSTSPEAESMFARFMTEKQSAAVQRGSQSFMPTVEEEEEEASEVVPPQSGGLNSSTLQMLFHSPQQQQQQLQGLSSAPATAVESPYRMMSSMAVAVAEEQAKSSGRSSLIRRSSSPAGLFSQLNVDNGFNMMRGMGGFRHGACSNGESGVGTSGRLKGQISFSSRQGSSRLMSQISEVGSDGIGGGDSSPEDGGSRDGNASGGRDSRCYIAGYPIASWDDSVMLSDSFSGSKRTRDPSENGEMRSHVSNLTHHLSLPRSSSDMSSMEKFLQFQDAVPCKIRAKRGCATHPRSIAERVRRTKISERMRKLQELVPSMDKQTNTADMLDLAVDYIKDLQKTVKTLSDDRSRCTCSSK